MLFQDAVYGTFNRILSIEAGNTNGYERLGVIRGHMENSFAGKVEFTEQQVTPHTLKRPEQTP